MEYDYHSTLPSTGIQERIAEANRYTTMSQWVDHRTVTIRYYEALERYTSDSVEQYRSAVLKDLSYRHLRFYCSRDFRRKIQQELIRRGIYKDSKFIAELQEVVDHAWKLHNRKLQQTRITREIDSIVEQYRDDLLDIVIMERHWIPVVGFIYDKLQAAGIHPGSDTFLESPELKRFADSLEKRGARIPFMKKEFCGPLEDPYYRITLADVESYRKEKQSKYKWIKAV